MQKFIAHLICRLCEVLLACATIEIAQRLGSLLQG
jgi:hypothetical protein